jgi:hypothetical protein
MSLSGCGSTDHSGTQPSTPATSSPLPATAGFGWSVGNFNNDSACAYFQVAAAMVLQGATIDAALQPSVITTAGGTQVLCRGWVSRGVAPTFANGSSASVGPTSVSADFGAVSIYNPGDVTVAGDAAPLQDLFYSAILRSWVPVGTAGASAARSVSALPALSLNAGDYLVFGIESQGVAGSVELQAVLTYQASWATA